LRLYELGDGATARAVVPTTAGEDAATFVAKREGQTITVERSGGNGAWRVVVVGSNEVVSAAAETAQVSIILRRKLV
jgi:alpha-D-xyloside xylohydrolase